MKYPQLRLENQLCHRLYMASNGIVRAYREELEALDLTYPQYVVMMALWEKDKITIAELINKTSIDGGAMTLILKKMTNKSLLVIKQDEKDKRRRFVELTAYGTKLQHKAAHIPDKMLCRFPEINKKEATMLMRLLDKVCNDLSNG